MPDRVGQQLGSYRLLRLLGQGGFAEVYLGEHIYLKTQAAVKVLHTLLAKEDMEGFLAEAQTIASLMHSNIVRVLDFGVDGSTPFLVMDYAPGGTLRQRHPRGTILQPANILPYVKQVAAALQYAHDRKLIHRDIKPENMLVGYNNEILLSDFGIAVIAQTSRSQSTQDVTGTIAYMAPEQIQGKPRLASDQYALGVVIYEWLSGDRPFHGSFTEIAIQHVLSPPPPLHEKIPAISSAVEEVVMKTLAKDPRERFLSVQAFATAFEQACRLEQSATVGSPFSSSPPSSLPLWQSTGIARPPIWPTETVTPPIQPTETVTAPQPQGVVTAPPQPELVSTLLPSSVERRFQKSGNYATAMKDVTLPKKGPNLALIIGTIVLLIVVISGSLYAFARGGFSNPNNTTTGNGSNGSGGTVNTGGGATSITASHKKVALVTDIGGLNDRGFNQLAYKGYTKARNQYSFPEMVIQTQSQNDYTRNLTAAANEADMVIAIGFLMQTPLDQVAKQFPNKEFAIVDGCALPAGGFNCETLPNVTPLFFKEQEAGCLVGAIAGQMELDGKAKIPKLLGASTVGAVGGISIPAVNRYIAGYKFCAQKVDPSINVVISYSQDFADTAKCKDAALSQISQHQADIIFQVAGGCGIGALDAADQQGVFGIGLDADQGYLHPSVITSAIKKVDIAVYKIIDMTEKGQYTNNLPKLGVADDGVGYAPASNYVPADAKARADEFAAMIKAGSLTPPETIP